MNLKLYDTYRYSDNEAESMKYCECNIAYYETPSTSSEPIRCSHCGRLISIYQKAIAINEPRFRGLYE